MEGKREQAIIRSRTHPRCLPRNPTPGVCARSYFWLAVSSVPRGGRQARLGKAASSSSCITRRTHSRAERVCVRAMMMRCVQQQDTGWGIEGSRGRDAAVVFAEA